jgi:hypothetical protein
MKKTLGQLLQMDDDALVDHVLDAWNASADAGRWDISDVRPTSDEDDRYDCARLHFGDWFEDFVLNAPDPLDIYAEGLPFPVCVRIAVLSEAFFYAVVGALEATEDFYQTWSSLPR